MKELPEGTRALVLVGQRAPAPIGERRPTAPLEPLHIALRDSIIRRSVDAPITNAEQALGELVLDKLNTASVTVLWSLLKRPRSIGALHNEFKAISEGLVQIEVDRLAGCRLVRQDNAGFWHITEAGAIVLYVSDQKLSSEP
jgi:hypothetical protein